MVMNGQTDIILLHEFLNSGKDLPRGGSNDHRDASGFDVFKLRTDVLVIVLLEVDGSSGGELEACGPVLSCPHGNLVCGRHGKMNVFQVEVGSFELFHKVDQVSLIEISERVTGDA